jgi:MATE family multidrug resistance protein
VHPRVVPSAQFPLSAKSAPEASSLRATARAIAAYAVPVSLTTVMQQLSFPVVLAFVGPMGAAQLGGASLAMNMFNATALALAVGLGGGLDTLLSQLHGNDPLDTRYGAVTQKMVVILAAASVPVVVLFVFLGDLGHALGLQPDAVKYMAEFGLIAAFAVHPRLLFETVRRFLQNQNVTRPVLAVQTAGLAALVVLLAVLIRPLGLGFRGAAAAFSAAALATCAALVVYTAFFFPRLADKWPRWSTRRALAGWRPVLREGLPSLGFAWLEYGVMEVNSLASGYLGATDLAAYAIALAVGLLLWCLSSGVYFAMSFFIGNAVGCGDTAGAKRFAIVGAAMLLGIASVNGGLAILFRYDIARLFTADEAVVERAALTIVATVALHVVDTQQCNASYIFRGIGRQSHGVAIYAAVWLLVGCPLCWLLTFHLGWGAPGLYAGLALAELFVTLPVVFTVMRRYDWAAMVPVAAVAAGIAPCDEEPLASSCDAADADEGAEMAERV